MINFELYHHRDSGTISGNTSAIANVIVGYMNNGITTTVALKFRLRNYIIL